MGGWGVNSWREIDESDVSPGASHLPEVWRGAHRGSQPLGTLVEIPWGWGWV